MDEVCLLSEELTMRSGLPENIWTDIGPTFPWSHQPVFRKGTWAYVPLGVLYVILLVPYASKIVVLGRQAANRNIKLVARFCIMGPSWVVLK